MKLIRDKEIINKNIGGVYFIKNNDNGLIKIGKTENISKRYKQINSSFKHCGMNPNLSLVGFVETKYHRELEYFIHNELKKFKVQNEWYSIKSLSIVERTIVNFEEPSKSKSKIFNKINNKKNDLKEFYVSNKMLKNKSFSYKLLLNIIYNCDYSTEKSQWFHRRISLARIKRWSGLSTRTIKEKLNHKIYKIKEDELGDQHLYISKPIDNFIIVNRHHIENLLKLDEMSIRLYLLIYGWKYNKVDCLSQAMILDMIGYSGKSKVNKQKLTTARRVLEEMNLIKSEVIRNEDKENIIYYKVNK